MQNSFEKRILDSIHACEGIGITIQDIAKLTSINRLTAAKYLAVMEARGIVSCRRIGRAKLYLPSRAKDETLKELKEGVLKQL
jgi:DNA-binding IclR family transcriptional regulator